MLAVTVKKNQDYSSGGDWDNFVDTSQFFGIPPYEAAVFNVIQKLSRIRSLRNSGQKPANETVEDTYLDLANYAMLAYAMYLDYHAERD